MKRLNLDAPLWIFEKIADLREATQVGSQREVVINALGRYKQIVIEVAKGGMLIAKRPDGTEVDLTPAELIFVFRKLPLWGSSEQGESS